jgi:hypothetical protein
VIEKGNEMSYNNLTRELQCYGMTESDIREEYMNSITARLSGLEMVVMGLLSDAQELQSFNHAQALDQSRKNMNIAKFILSEMMEARAAAA